MRAHRLFVASVVVVAIAASPVRAQDNVRRVPADRFEPAMDKDGLATVDTAAVPAGWAIDTALFVGLEDRPLTLGSSADRPAPALIGNRLRTDVLVAVSVLEWAQVAVHVPVVVLQGRDEGSAPDDGAALLSVFGPGDLRARVKLRVLSERHGQPIDLALVPAVSIPTGFVADYFGEEGFTMTPAVAASKAFGPLRIAANAGVRLRLPTEGAIIRTSHELQLKGGAGWVFDVVPDRRTEVALALQTAASVDAALRTPSQTEVLVEVEHQVWGPFQVVVGGGAGPIAGRGTPDFRLYAGVRGAFLRADEARP